MELRHLRYFLAAVEEQSIVRAAHRIHISQPALTRALHELEHSVGCVLLLRLPKGVQPTQEGEEFYRRAQVILGEVEDLSRELQSRRETKLQTFVISYLIAINTIVLWRLTQKLREKYPSVRIEFVKQRQFKQLETLRLGSTNVALTFVHGVAPQADIDFKPLSTEPLYVALPANHRLAGRSKIFLTDLADERFIFSSRSTKPGYYDFLMQLCQKAGFDPRVLNEQLEWDDIVARVGLGDAVSIIPSLVRIELPNVSYVRLTGENAHVTLHLAWLKSSEHPMLKDFLSLADELQQRIQRDIKKRRVGA